MTFSYQELLTELKKIRTVDLAYKATNILEKAFWALLGTIGALWIIYFISLQVGIDLFIGFKC